MTQNRSGAKNHRFGTDIQKKWRRGKEASPAVTRQTVFADSRYQWAVYW
jgi:hypothetical protein